MPSPPSDQTYPLYYSTYTAPTGLTSPSASIYSYTKWIPSDTQMEKVAALPPYTSLTNSLQQRALIRAASFYAFHDLASSGIPVCLHPF